MVAMKLEQALALIREIPDFPVPGIRFQDITPLLSNGAAFSAVTKSLACIDVEATLIAGIEARGFILASALANERSAGFIPIRKGGKLPHSTLAQSYGLEYGVDTLEMHVDAIAAQSRVLLIDDVLATGGTIDAAVSLIERGGGIVSHVAVLLEIVELKGRAKLLQSHPDLTVTSLLAI